MAESRLVQGEASEPAAIALLAQVVEYRVLQRGLIKKVGEDPAVAGAVKLARQVGSTVFTTGRTWTGPRGGTWVELDSLTERPGWLLVEGPGFGTPGPLLQKVEVGEEAPLLLRVEQPTRVEDPSLIEYRDFVVSPSAKVREAKRWIALVWGFNPNQLIIARPEDESATYKEYYGRKAPICQLEGLLRDDERLFDVGFRDGDVVQYVYIGNLAKAYGGKEPTWAQELGSAPQKPAKPHVATEHDYPELRNYFQVLGLAESTPPDSIKRHYRRLALDCHPDKHPDGVDAATRRFQEVKAAYEAIRDRLRF
eukprot:CAMPEP_0180619772 /NCGR_PEP_ID=MMETSP1037_2-20121125/34268_1 /TAXON_ID=632150 /ORGANISM="Azadinium spinosum, Strain 3D9" /LENGTH=308 /DNA_ID=CAMNT_0022639853 /DNA_START=1 /DNA_END=927 /DNA_ORIENTATION=+